MSFEQRSDQLLPDPPLEEPYFNTATNGERAAESGDVYGGPLPPAPVDETSKVVDDVLLSDVGSDLQYSNVFGTRSCETRSVSIPCLTD